MVADRLRCNLLTDPLAVADAHPVLSWVPVGGKRQTAFQIQASSDGRGADLWDTGKVGIEDVLSLPYRGQKASPRQTVYWRVLLWDEGGRAGEWSEWAHWTAAPETWQAEWIGFDEPLSANKPPDFMGTQWIWHADGPLTNIPVCTVVFRKTFDLDDAPDHAVLIGTGDDTFLAVVNGEEVGKSDGKDDSWRRPVHVDITDVLKKGTNTIEITTESHATDHSAMIAKILIVSDSVRREIPTDSTWEARFSDSDVWKPARQIGENGIPPWGGISVPQLFLPPPRVLSRAFSVRKGLKRAVLYATALGIFDATINGQRVGDDWFAPGWTDYRKRLHYCSYDVTGLLQQGDGSMRVVLRDGWFAGYVGFGKREHYGDQTRFSAMLWIDYDDGTSDLVPTDDAWRATTNGCSMSDLLMGEDFDAAAGPEDWHPVALGKELTPDLAPYPMDPVVVHHTVPAQSVTRSAGGTYVFDLGQNFAGVSHLRMSGQKAGKEVVLRHAEVLNPDGTVYTTNLRSARATDAYTTRDGDQEWSPRGTFHGFRYVDVAGLDAEPPKEMVEGRALSNVAKSACKFECSDDRLNQLWSNIDWTFRSNFLEIPTDCPQRDERLGWTGDIEVFCRTAMLLADVQAFLRKWLIDLADAQREDGQLPMVAPVVYNLEDGGPAWSDAGTIVPWSVYEVYEDKEVLERQYPSMVRFVDFCLGRMQDDGVPPEKFHCFGDWLNVGAETPHPVLYMLYLGRSLMDVVRAARVLGRKDDERKYYEAFRRACLVFRGAYVDEFGWVEGRTQTAQTLVLAFGMVEGDLADRVFARLAEDVERLGHLTTGFVGTKDLTLMLRDHGRTDLAYKLLLSEEYPGWLFSVKHGATSIWERWDGWTPEKGFQDPGMNSFAHYAFGAVGQFMVETIGGLRLVEPGYRKALIKPEPGPFEWCNLSYESVRGRFEVSWKGDKIEVAVPPGVSAQVEWKGRKWTVN
ncbi:MAG TPA: family 78 glycoside hydrolase catalytic domain [Fimbriimonadaceae bacterium]|nr:family 78 glycoside hydrolase catalytic domain [Fimbriimonadaceae bacterium]